MFLFVLQHFSDYPQAIRFVSRKCLTLKLLNFQVLFQNFFLEHSQNLSLFFYSNVLLFSICNGPNMSS